MINHINNMYIFFDKNYVSERLKTKIGFDSRIR